MGQGIQVPIVADVAQAVSGVRRLGDEFDKVSNTLDDVGTDAKASGAKVERSFSEAFAEVRRDAKRMGDDVAADTRAAVTGKGGAAVSEFKQEARQNFAEVASSFSGGVDSAADLVQGTLGGLAGSLPGPVGLISGLLAGVGGALWASMDDNAGKVEQRVQDMYDDMIESGLNYLSDEAVIEGINKIYQGADDAAISLSTAKGYAADLGVEVSTVVAAFAGSERAQQTVNTAIGQGKQAAADLAAQLETSTGNTTDLVIEATEHYDKVTAVEAALGRITGALDEARELTTGARDAAEEWTRTGAREADERERSRDAMREINQRYHDLEQMTFTPKAVTVRADLTEVDRQLRNYQPVVTIRTRVGSAQAV